MKLEDKLKEIHELQEEIDQYEVDSYKIAKIYSWIIGIVFGVAISFILYIS